MVSRFVPSGPVKQDGLCLLPPPPPHYRIMAPQRSEAYHNQGPYVQSAQGPNQGPGGLRNLQPVIPPNQPSTPPNSDLKVQNLPGQLQQMQYIPAQGVRSAPAPFYPRSAGPTTQPPRMANQQHRVQGPPQMYPPYVQLYIQPHQASAVQYNPRTNMMPAQTYPQVYPPQLTYSTFSLPATNPLSYGAVPAPGYPMFASQAPNITLSRTQVTPATATTAGPAVAGTAGHIPSAPLMGPPADRAGPSNYQRNAQKQRRQFALSIIDPATGADKLDEIFQSGSASHPPSEESSARQTPQPSQPDKELQVQAEFAKRVFEINEEREKKIQAEFAKKVAQLADEDNTQEPLDQPPSLHDPSKPYHHLPPPTITKYDVQHSTLQHDAKEFVSNTALKAVSYQQPPKETPASSVTMTPIVSANIDAAEVTLVKERESPAKAKKPSQPKQLPVETSKEFKPKETECDRRSSIVKEEPVPVPQVNVVSTPPVVPAEPASAVVKEPVKDVAAEKKGAKKVVQPENVPQEPEVTPQVTPAPDVSKDGKVKNARKHQPNQSQVQQQQQSQPQPPHNQNGKSQPLPVPVPQPPKANNKSNKTKEINLKGANKEGSDMDAFNDNTPKTEINANVLPPTTENRVSTNDVVNANSSPPTEQDVAPSTVVPLVNVETDSKIIISETNNKDSNENVTASTIKSEPVVEVNNTPAPVPAVPTVTQPAAPIKPLMNKTFDVRSIIKDSPKVMVPPFPLNNECRDETDRVTLSNDKLVMAKNDVNNKVSMKNAINDSPPSLPYKPGQWAPDRPDGKKIYDRDFLLLLRSFPASQQKPEHIADCYLQADRNNQFDGRLSVGGRTDFNPIYQNYGGKSGSRGAPPKRNSQQGKVGSRSGDKSSAKPAPKVSISLRGDVKLHEAENAWKPTRFQKGDGSAEEDKKTEELYKKVRSVLNKLTPQKFDTLVNQVRQLRIDTKEKLVGVINLVFEKATDEPNFSVAYAMMCKEIQNMQVPAGDEKKSVAFRTLLVGRCQQDFEKNSVDESGRSAKIKEIEECTDPEKKKELQEDLEEYDRRLRMKSVGTIRFIGELFKQQMLTANIMRRCLQTLLDNKDEESLEGLCKLLTTVGKALESKNMDLSSIFDEMKLITQGKRQKVSSRLRFMLQDVIDLRDSRWMPRRGDSNPKTIDQIQKEAETEQVMVQVMNQSMNMPPPMKRDDRSGGGGGGGGPRGGSRSKVNDEGWSSVGRANRTPFSIQTDKIRTKTPQADEPLGSSSIFCNWGKGAAGTRNTQPNANIYAALESVDMDRRPTSMTSRGSKDAYSSKGPSMERNSYKSGGYDGRNSRSGSQHRDTPMRGPPLSMMGPPQSRAPSSYQMAPPQQQQQQQHQPSQVANTPAQQPQTPAMPKLTVEQLERRIRVALDERLTGSIKSCDEYFQDIAAVVPPSDYSKVVYESFNYSLEKTTPARLETGKLFAELVEAGSISVEDICKGLEELLSFSEDLVIDIPQVWRFFAEDLYYLIAKEVMSFSRLHKLLDTLIQTNTAKKVLQHLFALIVEKKGGAFLHGIWKKSGLQLSDFMPASEVESFIQECKVEFLLSADPPVDETSPVSYEVIQKKLSEFLENQEPFDNIVNWITTNVGDRVKENKFIRTLATAIFENSIAKSKLKADVLSSHTKLIQKYVDTNLEYELQCLYALQSLIHKLEHPQGLLLAICDKLYEDSTFSQDSFIAWESSADPAEQEGKGVALKQLTSFFTQLKENEEEEEYSSNSDDA
ncbi:eukaryotic translation initiation factor 4 gamma 1-like isoform X3 [Anthonomus grandis grandis]|uniref:eukaryotic translation initiation factor 4 gamma 1-like isoform X3 n=1 Tax=Anthonomus grandis grandis TaxID=2921223 RepID=UPI002166656F|nr:eukaryotic translation initiation factor 4 gamma 1-like isoform X3 [Anthonomus grandis grandis]